MSAFQRMMQALQSQPPAPTVRGAIESWLRGEDLLDPSAVVWLKQFYPDLSVAGRDAPVRVGTVKDQMQRVPGAPGEAGAVGGGRDNQPGVAGYNSTPTPGAAEPPPVRAVTPPPPGATPGGGEPPPVRSVPQGGGLATQWAAGRPGGGGSGPVMNPVPSPSAASTQQQPKVDPGNGGRTMNPIPGGGGISETQGLALGPGGDNNFRLRQALKAAGIDPTSRGLRTQYLMSILAKPLAARGEMLGLEGNGADPTSYLDTLKNTIMSFITPGRSGSSEQRGLAQSIMGGGAFQNALVNADDTKAQQQMYQNLLQMMYGFENPAIQSAAQNIFGDEANAYQDNQLGFDGPVFTGGPSGQGLFSDFTARDPKSTISRILGGLYGR
jgi:hypothetical protein